METEIDKLSKHLEAMTVALQKAKQNLEKLQNQSTEKSILSLIENAIPLKTKDDLINFEANITNNVIPKFILINWMINIGGKSVQDCTANILKKVFADELGKISTWSGRNERINLGNLETTNCIRVATCWNCQEINKEIKEAVTKWAKQCKTTGTRRSTEATTSTEPSTP